MTEGVQVNADFTGPLTCRLHDQPLRAWVQHLLAPGASPRFMLQCPHPGCSVAVHVVARSACLASVNEEGSPRGRGELPPGLGIDGVTDVGPAL